MFTTWFKHGGLQWQEIWWFLYMLLLTCYNVSCNRCDSIDLLRFKINLYHISILVSVCFLLFEEILASLYVLYWHLILLYIFVHCNIRIVFDVYCTGMLYTVIINTAEIATSSWAHLLFIYIYVSFLFFFFF